MDANGEQRPPQVQAWLAFCLPILAWMSSVFAALFVRGAPAEVHFFLAAVEFGLLLGGLIFGIWALAKRGNSGMGIILPAGLGLVVSGGTILLVGVLIVAAAFG
jgi:hypothetical protein